MRRGGRLFLLLGLVLALGAAFILFIFLRGSSTPNENQNITAPTVVPMRQVVAAGIDIPSNTVLTDTETYLRMDEIPEDQYNASPNDYFTSFGELQNKVTLRPILATEKIRPDDVVEAGLSLQIPVAQPGQPRPKAVAFQVNNLSGVADQIKQGDFVDVIASFSITRIVLRPGFDDSGLLVIKEQEVTGQSTKTLVQNVQVLKILKPQAPAEGTPTPGTGGASGPPQTDESGQPVQGGATPGEAPTGDTFQPGSWLLILAVTDQQAEVIKFSIEQGTGITLVLRGRGDTAVENTIGATLDLLISRFGLPMPEPIDPASISPNDLTPLPTTTIAPTPGTAPTPTP